MIHPFGLVLSGLLALSAILGGHLPAVALLLCMVSPRGTRVQRSSIFLILVMLFASLQLTATLVVNLVVLTSVHVRDAVFRDYCLLTKTLGVYEVGVGAKGWIAASACIPSVLLLLYVSLMWRRLLRRVPVKLSRPLLTTFSWAFLSIVAALIAPTVLGAVLLLIGMITSLCIGFGAEGLLFRGVRQRDGWTSFSVLYAASICGTLISCIILMISCVSQNALAAYVFRNVDTIYGLSKLYDQPLDVAICRFMQIFLVMITLFLAGTAVECNGECLRREETDALFFPDPSASRIQCVSTAMNVGDADAAEALAPRVHQQTRRESLNDIATTSLLPFERLAIALENTSAFVIRALLAGSRMVPLLLMAINMTLFPTIPTLSLLPMMMAGQLLRQELFLALLRPTLILSLMVVSVQYVVLAINTAHSSVMRRLFLSDENGLVFLVQVICNEVLFLVMLAADVVLRHHAHFAKTYRQSQSCGTDTPPTAPLARELSASSSESSQHPQLPLQSSSVVFTEPRETSTEDLFVRDNDDTNKKNNGEINHGGAGTQNKGQGALSGTGDTLWCANNMLGQERVSELLAYVSNDCLGAREAFEKLFLHLIGRGPRAEEIRCLSKDGVGNDLLLEKLQLSRKPVLLQYMHWAGILFIHNATLIVLLLLFIVGSFTYHMDIIHAVVLLFFAMHFFFRNIMDDIWVLVLVYLMLLTSFELVFTFVSQFFTLPAYVMGSQLQYATIGLVPLRSRYEIIPYLITVFVVSCLFRSVRVCRTWGMVISLHEWNRFCRSTAVLQWTMRLTMVVATTVFVALGVFMQYSLIVEGFLALFLLLAMTAAFLGLYSTVLGCVWCVACVYSSLIMLITTVCQFTQLAHVVQEYIFDRICSGDADGQCRRESGLFPAEYNMPLTLFLAPWFLAFATAMSHIAVKRAGNKAFLSTKCDTTERGMGEGSRRQSIGLNTQECETAHVIIEHTPPLSFNGGDQIFIRHCMKLIAGMDVVAKWFTTFGADYGGALVWVTLIITATRSHTAIGAVYVLFLLLDFTHLSVLIYCVLHILVVYTYQFSAVPEISYTFRGVSLASLIGLDKDTHNSPSRQVFGPVLVLFAVLFRISTHDARGITRCQQRMEGPESSSWRTVLFTQLFFYGGYEIFILTLLIALLYSADSCIGVLVGCALLLLLLPPSSGRQRFHIPSFSLVLLVLLSAIVLWYYALGMNAQHGLFTTITENNNYTFDLSVGHDTLAAATDEFWRIWVFASRQGSLISCLVGVMLLHTNRQQARDTALYFSFIRAKFGGHITLIDFIRAASVKSLQRLSLEEFNRVVPHIVESSPPSRLGCVSTCMIFAVSYLHPVAVFSFAAGVTLMPSIINLLLLVGGLMQMTRSELLHWKFFRLWPPAAAVYCAVFVCFPIICNVPYVRQFLLQNSGFFGAVGFTEDGRPFQLNALHIVLLFAVTLQTRVYCDFRYTKLLRRLYNQTYMRQSRHEELWERLRAKYEAERQLAKARSQALHAKLDEVRRMTCITEGICRPENIPTNEPSKKGEASGREEVVTGPQSFQTNAGAFKDHHERVLSEVCDKNHHSMTLGDYTTRGRRIRLWVYRVYKACATKMADWLAAHTYEPQRHTAATYRSTSRRLFCVLIRALERHTAMLTLIVTMVNFMLTHCVWEMIPFCFILVVANTYNPFAPRFIYKGLSIFVALGVVLKAFIDVVLAHVSHSPSVLKVLSWTILHVSEGAYWKEKVVRSYMLMDLVVYAVLLVHLDICLFNGVYSRNDILRSRFGNDANLAINEQTNDANTGAITTSAPAPADDDDAGNVPTAEPTNPIAHVDTDVADSDTVTRVKDVPIETSSPLFSTTSVVSQYAIAMNQTLHSSVTGFVRNAICTPGVGRDWYIYYFSVDVISLLLFVLGYNKMSGRTDLSLQESLRRNVLPGPMVIVVLVSILVMIVDRMLYVTRCMKGKLLLNLVSGVVYSVCYLVWGNIVVVQSRTMGNVFFVLKILALTIAVLQLRVGYPRHRRHDPFTATGGRSTIASVFYRLYRTVPFLWEIRMATDWTVERTALRFGNYLKIEDLYDIVYGRQRNIHEAQEQQPILGTRIRCSTKLSDGLFHLLIIMAALMVPLFYYSTFNPSMELNRVTELRVTFSLMSSQNFFSSTAFSSAEYPNEWPLWVARTRPTIADEGIMDSKKTLQLMDMSSCSSELWSISPQALRLLKSQLTDAMENRTTVFIFQSLQLSSILTSGSATHTVRWPIPSSTAGDILRMLNGNPATDTDYVLLPNFYSPFLFNRQDGIEVYNTTHGGNLMDCSIRLRREMDVDLSTAVNYWCLKCQSLFTSGNIPSDNTALFPEWHCLSTGEGCDRFNREERNGDASYYPIPMYYVILSDSFAGGVILLRGIGIIALYTTFVLAVARIFREMFAGGAENIILTDMADPTPVAQLIEYIAIARECGDMRLEQSVYFELIDLVRSPERLLRLTGFNRRMYDADTDALHSPPTFRPSGVEGDVNNSDDDAAAAPRPGMA